MSDNEAFAEPFANMAETIRHNTATSFAGAAVIVPPGGGRPLDLFQMGQNPDEGQFWSTILTSIQIRLNQLQDQKQVGRTFGIR